MKKNYLLLILYFFVCNRLYAQTEIKGRIVDEQQKPLAGAVIACMSNKENKLIRGLVTDNEGQFSIQADAGTEWIRISYMGYETRDYHDLKTIPDIITLKLAHIEIEGVTVQAQSYVSQKADRLVFQIANPNVVKGNNTIHLLKFTPLLEVQDDQVRMLGKSGIQLYLNGKKSSLSGIALQQYLKSLPANKIERIELITNPGSEYKIGDNEGIIDLILKKNETEGWKGSLALNDRLGVNNSYNGNIYLDYQKSKYQMSVSAYGQKNKERFNHENRYDYLDFNQQNEVEMVTRLNHIFTGADIRIDYNLSDKHTLGAMADISYARKKNNLFTNTFYKKLDSGIVDSIEYAPNLNDETDWDMVGNLNYRWDTDSRGSKFTTDIDFAHKSADNEGLLDYYSSENNIVMEDPYSRIKQETENVYDIWSGAIAYYHVSSSNHSLKTGADVYYLDGYTDFFYGNFTGRDYVSDPRRSNRFNYKEGYAGLYLSSNNRWNDKFSSVIGIRGEYIHRTGIQKAGNKKIKKEDYAVLPSLTLNYRPNNDHIFSYSLSMHKVRPSLTMLNTFRTYESPTVYRENNPDLPSTYSFNNSFRYVLKNHYTFMVMYMTSKIMTGFQRPVEGGYTQTTTECFGQQHSVLLSFNWNNSFFDNRLMVNASANGVYGRTFGSFDDYHISETNRFFYGSLNLNWTVSRKRNLNASCAFFYKSPDRQPEYRGDQSYRLNVRIQKSFRNDISLNIGSDVLLGTTTSQRDYFTTGYRSYKHTDYHFRKFYAGLTISFGHKKVSGAEGTSGSSYRGSSRIRE